MVSKYNERVFSCALDSSLFFATAEHVIDMDFLRESNAAFLERVVRWSAEAKPSHIAILSFVWNSKSRFKI